MKIFFSMSFRSDMDVARKIVATLRKMGHDVTNKSYDDETPKLFYEWSKEQRLEHYKKVFKLIRECDLVVLESSIHSLTVGQMIQESIDNHKPLLILIKPGTDLAFLDGMSSDDHFNILKTEYELNNLEKCLGENIAYLSEKRDIRFTLLLPPDIIQHLDAVSDKGINRSEYIRKLIHEDMENEA